MGWMPTSNAWHAQRVFEDHLQDCQPRTGEGKTRMSTDENKALAFRYFDQRWNHHNDSVIGELLGGGMSPEDEKAHLEATHAAFGEIEFTVDGLIAEGDEVAVRWTATSNHQGEAHGFAATGKRITFHGLASLRIVDGKIVRFDGFSDILETLSSVS
jgi:predicted ester cyclase